MANSQRRQAARERRVFTSRQGIEQLLSGPIAHSFEAGQLLFAKTIQIGYVMNQAAFDQLIDQLFAQALDVHGAPGAEEFEALLELRGTGNADTAIRGFAFFSEYLRAANRTTLGHDKFFFLSRAFLFDNFDDV